MNKQGRTYNESAFCMFDGHTDLQFTDGKDLLIEGDCAIEVDTADARKQSESMDRLVKAGAFTIMLADYKSTVHSRCNIGKYHANSRTCSL